MRSGVAGSRESRDVQYLVSFAQRQDNGFCVGFAHTNAVGLSMLMIRIALKLMDYLDQSTSPRQSDYYPRHSVEYGQFGRN